MVCQQRRCQPHIPTMSLFSLLRSPVRHSQPPRSYSPKQLCLLEPRGYGDNSQALGDSNLDTEKEGASWNAGPVLRLPPKGKRFSSQKPLPGWKETYFSFYPFLVAGKVNLSQPPVRPALPFSFKHRCAWPELKPLPHRWVAGPISLNGVTSDSDSRHINDGANLALGRKLKICLYAASFPPGYWDKYLKGTRSSIHHIRHISELVCLPSTMNRSTWLVGHLIYSFQTQVSSLVLGTEKALWKEGVCLLEMQRSVVLRNSTPPPIIFLQAWSSHADHKAALLVPSRAPNRTAGNH